MSFSLEIGAGKTVKLPTAGKYCDRDVLVTGNGYTEADMAAKYDAGKVSGLSEGAEICAAKHFVHTFIGDGSSSLSFSVPFEPDAVQVTGFDPLSSATKNAVMLFFCDLRAFGMPGGFTMKGNVSSITYFAVGTRKIEERYARSEDGFITIKDVAATGDPAIFAEGFVYTVVAVKYTQQTDTERITDFVNRLDGSGTVTLNQAKISAAFTDDAWAALIAAKPDWTFVLT